MDATGGRGLLPDVRARVPAQARAAAVLLAALLARLGGVYRTRSPPRDKVERPSYEQLLADLRELSWVAVGSKYGVSDNAVRKWLRRYEAEQVRGVRLEGPRVIARRIPLRCAADAHPDRRRRGRRPAVPRRPRGPAIP